MSKYYDPSKPDEERLHKVIKRFLSNRLQGYVMGAWRQYTTKRPLPEEPHGDGCKFCLGAKGGVPGNENLIGGEVICDYCTSLLMKIKDAEKANPTSSIFANAAVPASEHDEPTHPNHPGHHDGHTCEAIGKFLGDLGSQRASVREAATAKILSPAPVSGIPVVFGMRGPKMTFTIGVQSFTLDYEPDVPESFEFMSNMLTIAITSANLPAEQAGELPLPVATLVITRGLFDYLKEMKVNLLTELPAGAYDLFTSTQLKSHAARQATGETK